MKRLNLVLQLLALTLLMAILAAAPVARGESLTEPTIGYFQRVQGAISTQNLVPTGTATANSAVEAELNGASTMGVDVRGTYTGALSLQTTLDGINWTTGCSATCTATFTKFSDNTTASTIGSGVTGYFTVYVGPAFKARITGLAAVTGSATVTLRGVASASGSSGSGGTADSTAANQATQITAEQAIQATIGAKTDAKSTATDATSISAMQVLKEISAMVQTIVPGSATAASDATRLPVSEPDGLAVSGTCASTCTNVVLFAQSLVGYESWSVAVTSAGTGATITYQLSNDTGACGSATNWYNVQGWQPVAGASAAPAATTTTAVLTQFARGSALCARAQITAYSSGTVTVAASFAKSPAGDGAKHVYTANMPVQTVAGSVGTTSILASCDGRSAAPTAVSTGQASRVICTLDGRIVVLPYAMPELTWNYAAASGGETGTGDLTLAAAPAAGLRNYLSSCSIQNASATIGTEVVIKDGATVLKRYYVGVGSLLNSVVNVSIVPPLRQPTTATALTAANITTASAVYWNCNGYQAP